ncbi:hypothetical protein ILUMI_06671 [Ignelater luminosus]|uniref:Dehydrogenase/reductase SDR family member 4 n=1 Tax=Ignelater luminosus TaxID=2038154 RepID=A0A8K0D5A2_IGNLU|nr:hypothetical protein ILUMI_06671 [Ignelater luminosus]
MSQISKRRLDGKIAVVAGSTMGIGYAVARRFAQEGAKVIISSRKQCNVDAAVSKLTAEGLNVIGLVCHVAKAEDRKRVFDEADKLGGLDILVLNAAVNPMAGMVLDCDESEWDKVFEINVKAAFLIAKEGLPLIRRRGGGSIVFMSSVVAFHPVNFAGAYAVSKTALLGLTKAAAVSLATENITVNCVAPGLVKTRFAEYITETEAIRDSALALIPMNRFGIPEDIAGIVAFLVSEDARYITGETIIAAGGASSRL